MSSALRSWKETAGAEGLKSYRQFVTDRDKTVRSFLEFDPIRIPESGKGSRSESKLSGLPFAAKDNISIRNFHLTCGSKILGNFVAPYNATAVQKLLDAGAIAVGKTNLDEFGMGSSTDNSAFQQTNNPWDLVRVCGGSSGGSAAAVAAGLVPFALGSDTGGSIRQPASFCGVYGLKPSYGAVSRYGLVAYASSLEGIGVLARDLDILETVFSTIQGPDPMDQTTIRPEDFPITKKTAKVVGVLKNIEGLDPDVASAYETTIAALKKSGYSLLDVELPMLEYSVASYYTIASAEASANLARFNGIRYGERPVYSENPDALVRKARDQGFGPEVKLRILLGTFVLRSGFQDQYYARAQKIRTAIKGDFDNAFKNVDLLAMPVFPTPAFPHGESGLDAFQQKLADKFTTCANLSGNPGLSIPGPTIRGLPVGMQLLAPVLHEHLLFEAARRVREELPPQVPAQFPEAYA